MKIWVSDNFEITLDELSNDNSSPHQTVTAWGKLSLWWENHPPIFVIYFRCLYPNPKPWKEWWFSHMKISLLPHMVDLPTDMQNHHLKAMIANCLPSLETLSQTQSYSNILKLNAHPNTISYVTINRIRHLNTHTSTPLQNVNTLAKPPPPPGPPPTEPHRIKISSMPSFWWATILRPHPLEIHPTPTLLLTLFELLLS